MLKIEPKVPTIIPPVRRLKQHQKLSADRQPMMKGESNDEKKVETKETVRKSK